MFSAAEEVIFALRTQGMSQKGVAAWVGCSQSTVSRILKKDFPAPVSNGGRPKMTSPQDNRTLKRIAHSNRFKSTTSITHLWNDTMTSPVSRSTTYRQLRFHGFSNQISCTKPLLSWKQKKKHLQFAQKYSKWMVEDWKQVIFSDESKFVMGYGNKGPHVWRQKYERHKVACPEALCQASGLCCGLGMRVILRSWKFVLLVSQDDSQHRGVHRSARCLPASICR